MKQVLAMIVMTILGASVIGPAAGSDPPGATSPKPGVSPELTDALRTDKLTKPPPVELLADKPALVRQLGTFVDGPKGEAGNETAVVRRRAVILLGRYGGSDAVPALQKLAADEKEEYRRDAVIGLGRTGTAEGVKAAAAFLTHADELFREAAIDGLASAGTQSALDALKKFDPSKDKEFIQRKYRDAVEKLTAKVKSVDKK